MGKIDIPACGKCKGNCYGCFYADECPQWLDVSPYTPSTVTVNCVRLALCESRHPMPDEVEGSIFPEPSILRVFSDSAQPANADLTQLFWQTDISIWFAT